MRSMLFTRLENIYRRLKNKGNQAEEKDQKETRRINKKGASGAVTKGTSMQEISNKKSKDFIFP
jgi:hypothetical protein